MEVPVSERALLLRVAAMEEGRGIRALERVLGTYWTFEEMASLVDSEKSKGKGASKTPTDMSIPLAMLMRPETLDYLKSVFGLKSNVAAISVDAWASLSLEERKEFANAKPIAELSPAEAKALLKSTQGFVK